MDRVRTVLGFVLGAFFVAGALMHSTLGWKNITGQLVAAKAPQELTDNLALAWHLSGAAMFTFGCILIFLFWRYLRDRSTSLRVAQMIGLFYTAYGIWALVESRNSFFVITFVVPAVLLLAASTGAARSESRVA